ncbi:MAG: hypothetical protein Q8S73_34600 [Deltaproteobacteria bacterium]|nr:hypothetical protein [Myxococcales bacterium]MDP3219281.1 hypothetical protein [Deltaproteobacteria bacterium]
MAPPRPTPLAALAIALAALCAANVLPRAGRFSGDAMIHLGLAERAAAGAWWEFNPGELASATTSPAWTALAALLLRLGGFPLALPVLSLVSLAALALAALLVRRLALRLGAAGPAAPVGALLFAALPGVASNAPLAMENTAFAAAALAFLLLVSGPGRVERAAPAAACGALLGACVLLRPEGVVLAIGAVVALRDSPPTGRVLRGAALALAAVAVVAPVAYLHWRVTGRWLPGSGLSRVMAARRDPSSLHLGGPLWLYLAAPARLLVHLPLVGLALEGARPPSLHPTTRRALVATLGAGFALYTLVTGAAHVARLTQWLWAMLAALAAVGLGRQLARVAGGDRTRGRWLAGVLVAHVTIGAAETVARWRSPSQGSGGLDRATLLHAIDGRRARTDRLLRALCAGGCCREGEVPAVAVVEVQRRLILDGRVSVASLDGVAAPVGPDAPAVTFDPATGCPRIDALLEHRRVIGLLEDPSAQLGRCVSPSLARSLSEARSRTDRPPTGWRWDAALHTWIRGCRPVDQPSSSAAPSIASASRTVASRTAARPTSP